MTDLDPGHVDPAHVDPAFVDAAFGDAVAREHHHDPYPYWARLRRRPVMRRGDGSWVVGGYAEIAGLLRDPRISAVRHPGSTSQGRRGPVPFLRADPPDHDRLRAVVVDQLVPRVAALRAHIEQVVRGRLDAVRDAGTGSFDAVADLAYPLPVAIICELLGIPASEEPRFRDLARRTTRGLDPIETLDATETADVAEAGVQLREYLHHVVRAHRTAPGDDMLSAIIAGGALDEPELLVTLGLLLVAGHETTVNLIANGILTLLRHPQHLQHLRTDPSYAYPLVEELLRFEPPVQMSGRGTLADIDIAGTHIPAGSQVRLLIAAGNRDERRFTDPETFDPLRPDNAHLGFGGGVHYCAGAALARTETQIALTAFARHVQAPRLLADPPPYRANALLRGPSSVAVAFDAVM